MKLELDGINNPGWSFTEVRMEQLMLLFDYIDSKSPEKIFRYRDLQDNISGYSSKLDASKVRMFFPWLQHYGVLNDYENITVYGELFTKLGEGFKQFIPIFLAMKTDSADYSELQIAEINNTFEAFINNFYYNLLDTEKGPIYSLIIDILQNLNQLSFNEFFVLTHALQHDLDREWIFDTIQKMRDPQNVLEVEITSGKNAWGYIVPFLKEAGLIVEIKRVIYLKQGGI